jgi:hypothetical protein
MRVDVLFPLRPGEVYALSQMPTSNQQGVWQLISQSVRYIDWIIDGSQKLTGKSLEWTLSAVGST